MLAAVRCSDGGTTEGPAGSGEQLCGSWWVAYLYAEVGDRTYEHTYDPTDAVVVFSPDGTLTETEGTLVTTGRWSYDPRSRILKIVLDGGAAADCYVHLFTDAELGGEATLETEGIRIRLLVVLRRM